MSFNAGDVIMVKFVSTSKPANQNLSVGINIMHYNVLDKVGGGAGEQEVADGFSTALSLKYSLMYNITTRFEGVIVQRVHPAPLGVQWVSQIGSGAGARPFETLPFQVCGAITKLTPFAGRKYRGRVYVPFPLEDDQTATNQPSANYTNFLFDLGAQLIAARTFGAAGLTSLQSVIYHGGAAPAHITAVTGIHVRDYWTSQRRRNNAWRADTIPI